VKIVRDAHAQVVFDEALLVIRVVMVWGMMRRGSQLWKVAED
jgi:hypothetical protein